MKISPIQMWYPNWPVNPGHNSIYYNNVERGALNGPTQGDPSRINSGALRNWVEPVASPAVVLHINKNYVA